MAAVNGVRTRPVGASAVVGKVGFPHVTSLTGGSLDIVTGPSQPGFSPIDLLYASLAGCLAMSARIAASRFGVHDRLKEVTAHVSGDKAEDEPSRIERFVIRLGIKGDFDETVRHAIAEAAELEICTVSNTLRGNPQFSMTVSD